MFSSCYKSEPSTIDPFDKACKITCGEPYMPSRIIEDECDNYNPLAVQNESSECKNEEKPGYAEYENKNNSKNKELRQILLIVAAILACIAIIKSMDN